MNQPTVESLFGANAGIVWMGNSELVHHNTLGSDRIPDDIAPLGPGK